MPGVGERVYRLADLSAHLHKTEGEAKAALLLHQHAVTPPLFNALPQCINAPSAINISAGAEHRSLTHRCARRTVIRQPWELKGQTAIVMRSLT